MKLNQHVTQFIVLVVLIIGVIGGYSLGKSAPQVENSSQNSLPPLIELDLPPQTMNGITADLESYYADGLRLIFAIRFSGEGDLYLPDIVFIKDDSNQMVNASYSFHASEEDQNLYLIDAYLESPLPTEEFIGVIEISVYPFRAEAIATTPQVSEFKFDVNVSASPALTFSPQTAITVNDVKITLEKLIISSSYTRIYLCYNKPTNADWGVGGDVEFTADSQKAYLSTYSLLYDTDYGDVGKSIEPDWSISIEKGRCIKLGFPTGSENPQSITLRIPTLNQSMPEAIPEDELAIAREKLLEQGIDMDWQIIAYPEGGGSSGPIYNKLPEGMSEEEAYGLFIEALGYIHHGPWEFTITP